MKYYDLKGKEISKYAFYKAVSQLPKEEYVLRYETGKTGSGEYYRRLIH